MNIYIMVFNNTHEAMAGEKLMQQKGIKCMVMPTPTYLTNSCGISLRFDENVLAQINSIIEKDEIKFKNIYLRDTQGFKLYK